MEYNNKPWSYAMGTYRVVWSCKIEAMHPFPRLVGEYEMSKTFATKKEAKAYAEKLRFNSQEPITSFNNKRVGTRYVELATLRLVAI